MSSPRVVMSQRAGVGRRLSAAVDGLRLTGRSRAQQSSRKDGNVMLSDGAAVQGRREPAT